MKRALACLIAGFAPVPALALSCLPYPIEAAWTDAAQSSQSYVVVHGTLRFDPAMLPRTDPANAAMTPPRTQIPAHLSGRLLGEGGFATPVDLDLTLVVLCYGPWCAGAADGADALAFLRETPAGYVLEVNPCGGFLFGAPTPEMTQRVADCFLGADCTPARP